MHRIDPTHTTATHRPAPGTAARTTATSAAAAPGTSSRATQVALVTAGVLFTAYPALRPFSDEKTLDGARAYASTSWVVAHSLAIVGFVLLGLALFGLVRRLQQSPADGLATRGALVAAAGIGLTLPFYGAEVFGLHALGQEAIDRNDASLVQLADSVRFGVGIAFITLGLLALAVGLGMLARAIWRSGVLARSSGVTLAVAFALYLPQYSAAQPVRVAHGVLVLIGCVLLARALGRSIAPATGGARRAAAPRDAADDIEVPAPATAAAAR